MLRLTLEDFKEVIGAIRGGGGEEKTTAIQHFLVFGVFVVASFLDYHFCTSSFRCICYSFPTSRSSTVAVQHRRSVYLHVYAMPLYSSRHDLPSLRCIQLSPACRKQWVRRRGINAATSTWGSAQPALYFMRGKKVGKVFLFLSSSPDHIGLTSVPSRPGDPSCPFSPYQNSTISWVWCLRQRLHLWNGGNGIKVEAGEKTLCPFNPGMPSSPDRPFLPCRNERSQNKPEGASTVAKRKCSIS